MHENKKWIKYIILVVFAGIGFYWLLNQTERVQVVWNFVSGMVAPFVVGAALAFILNVPMRGFEGWFKGLKMPKLRRGIALVLTLISVGLVIAGVVMLLIPQIESTVQDIVRKLPPFFERAQTMIWQFLEERPELMDLIKQIGVETIDWKALIQKALDYVETGVSSVLSGTISAVSSLVGVIYDGVVSIVFAIYCLCSKETLARQGRKLLYAIAPEKAADEIIRILRMTNSSFSNFITGQCLEAVILGLMFVVAMLIFRMPYIPLISVLIAVTALVPMVGAFVGCVLGAFFILVNDPMQAVFFVIMFLIIQQIEGNLIYPRVVGSSIGLPGMWVLLAVAVGGELFGMGGMLMMVPFASVLYTLAKEYTNKRLNNLNIDAQKLVPQPPDLQPHFIFKKPSKKKSADADKDTEE